LGLDRVRLLHGRAIAISALRTGREACAGAGRQRQWHCERSSERSIALALTLPAEAREPPEENSAKLDKSTAFMQIVSRFPAMIEAAYLSQT
jgi:hypothetical protein